MNLKHTTEGKYAFVLNDPIHKETFDVLSNRKKEYLIQYFTYTEKLTLSRVRHK